MKTKLIISLASVIFLLTILPTTKLRAEDVSTMDTPIQSKELPSYTSLQREKRSLANTQVASLATPILSTFNETSPSWEEIEPIIDWQDEHNVGATAPLGDVSLIVVIIAIAIYSVYRGASTSRRKNNF